MDDKNKVGGLRGFLKRKLKLRDNGLLGYVNKRQSILDEAAAPISMPKKKKKKKEMTDMEG